MLQNIQHELFAQEYIVDFNATQAAIRAGYNNPNPGSLRRQAHDLYHNKQIRARIVELLHERRGEYAVTVTRVVQELARIAFASPLDVLDEFNGARIMYKRLEDIPKKHRAAIKSLKISRAGVSVEFHDKVAALDKLARHLGMYELDNDQRNKPQNGPTIYIPDNGRDNPLPEKKP